MENDLDNQIFSNCYAPFFLNLWMKMSLKSASEYKDLQLRMNSKVQAVLKGGTAARDYEYENSMYCPFAPALDLQQGRSADKPRRFEIFV